jgi:hypothetical protein
VTGGKIVKNDKESKLPSDEEEMDQRPDIPILDVVKEHDTERDTDTEIAATDGQLLATSFTKIEKSLASLGFFTPSSRRIKGQRVKRISFTREVDGKRVEGTAEIFPTILGLPVTADQDKYLALQKMITDILQTEGKITNPIRFTSADLLRLLNQRVRTGKNYKDIVEWLDVMASTTIISNGVLYIAGQKRFARDRFHVFDRAVSVGKELDDGTIADANYVWLSNWQIENINHNFLLPIDLETYRMLKNHIAKALVPLLQIWLFASHKAGSFEKRYDEICEILNLQKYKAPSLITRQFKPSLDELTSHGYLEQWRIEKTTDRKAYKITLFHGPKFHRDRRKRIEQKMQAEVPLVIARSQCPEPSLPQPGKIDPSPPPAKLAHRPQQGGGKTQSAAPASQPEPSAQPGPEVYPSHETDPAPNILDELVARGLMASVAMKLLANLSLEQTECVTDYIDYWDFAKATNDVGPGFLYDLIKQCKPLPSGFEVNRQRLERKVNDERSYRLLMAKQMLDFAYDQYSRETIDQFIDEQFSKAELEHRIQTKKRELSSHHRANRSAFSDQIAQHAVRAEIAPLVPLISFADFCRREAPGILSEYQIDPADLGIY